MKAIYKINLLLIILALTFQSCNGVSSNDIVKGDGNVTVMTHDVDGFNSIDLRGMFNVVLSASETEKVVFEADSNLHSHMTIEVKDNTLMVYTDRKSIYKPTKMNLHIYYVEIEEIVSGGASKIKSTDCIVADKLKFDLSGATDLNLELNVSELVTNASGASNLVFSGNAVSHDIDLSGAGSLKAENFSTVNTSINLSGAGSAHVFAAEALNANISGVGSVYYSGNPINKNFSKSGLGKIKSMN